MRAVYEAAKALDGDARSLSAADLDSYARSPGSCGEREIARYIREKMLDAPALPDIIIAQGLPHNAAGDDQRMVRSVYPVRGLYWADRVDNSVVLTFDDGPHKTRTKAVLDALQARGVHATFFVCGNNIRGNEDLIRRMVAEGHTIGNHTWDHTDMRALSPEQIAAELDATQQEVDRALGYHYPLTLVRPPYGGTDQRVVDLLNSRGEQLILWGFDSLDWKYQQDGGKILSRMTNDPATLKGGGVVLMHDIQAGTADRIGKIIDELEGDGRRLDTVQSWLDAKYGATALPADTCIPDGDS